MKSSDIRQKFLDFFAKKNHQVVSSSSLVPSNDKTLLFTNAGMVQFKDVFLGLESRDYNKATTSQRCLRAGGKHNDLENVGYTARHHTFFEMLGNFSFGDYFKAQAIRMAWEFLTEELNIPKEKLWVTVHLDDDEAANIWKNEIGVDPARMSRCDEDNFWSMGDTGPCGPCTEIFYDHGPSVEGGPPGSENEDGDRYIEIWNLVFMQYNRDGSGNMHPLPKPSVDTGMGLERISAVIQGVKSNYDIDLFQHLIQFIANMTEVKDTTHPSIKVIADHIRACAFLLIDGVLPSNEGRGYVLRRIIRRAIRHGHKLGLQSPFFHKILQPLIEQMGQAYPELSQNKAFIEKWLQDEELQFAKTLDVGLKLLHKEIQLLKDSEIPGELAFKLYDTYGFPVDLTADIAREMHLALNMKQFDDCMNRQKEMSLAGSQFKDEYFDMPNIANNTEFLGYEQHNFDGHILNLIKDNQLVKTLSAGEKGMIIIDKTPFYGESGGQVGDVGTLEQDNGLFVVEDTKIKGNAIVHIGFVKTGILTQDRGVHANIDKSRRQDIRLNHTATHLLHAALKHVLGASTHQKGSLVEDARARFDFSYHQAVTHSDILSIESLVNAKIRENILCETQVMDMEAAKEAGAVALFGEKYKEQVRVLSIGNFSKELCGGTHVSRTGDIGLFKITSEQGIANGVRRIEFVTGRHAFSLIQNSLNQMNLLAEDLKTTTTDVPKKLKQLIEQNKTQLKTITTLQHKLAQNDLSSWLNQVESIGEMSLLIQHVEDSNPQNLRSMLDTLKSKLKNAIIVLYVLNEDKIHVVCAVSKSIINISAIDIVKTLCGKGGGREDMAQGGGILTTNISQQIKKVRALIEKQI